MSSLTFHSFCFFNNYSSSKKSLSSLKFENNKSKKNVYETIKNVKYKENLIIKKIRKF